MIGGRNRDGLGVAGESFEMHPLEQFALHRVPGPLGTVNFTQANAFMVVGGLLVLGLLMYGMRPRATVPGRVQALAEMLYEFMHGMVIDQIGPEGGKFFPFLFTLFAF